MTYKAKPTAAASPPGPQALLRAAAALDQGPPGASPDGPLPRAQRLMSGAFYSAAFSGCECGACRRLRKVARLTVDLTEEDLDDAQD